MNSEKDRTWWYAYDILRAYGRSDERAKAVLKGDPNQDLRYIVFQEKRLKSKNIAQNKPFSGHSWQV